MSTVYPLTTKYLKKGGSSGDIDQLVEDINELKQDVAGIEEVDETQNTDITNLKNDVQTLQTSDLTQNAEIDKLRHQLYLRVGYKNYQSTVLKHFPDHTSFIHSRLIVFKNKTKNFYNNDDEKYFFKVNYLSLNNKMTLDFRAGKTDYYSINTSLYVYINEWRFAGGSGIEIINGLGEYVLTTGITFRFVYEIFPSTDLPTEQYEDGEILVRHIDLRTLINNYGTDYYKEHVNDDFDFTNCFSNSYCWDSDNDIITNMIKTNLTSQYTSSDYETMTNLKDWVESKAGGTTPTTLKCPVDLYLSNDNFVYQSIHLMPARVRNSTYKIGGNSCDAKGYYIAFHSSTSSYPYHVMSITILWMESGGTFPTFTWDSLCKFYKIDCTDYVDTKHSELVFIMNDGTECRTDFILKQYNYIHFYTNLFTFDRITNNIIDVGGTELEFSTYIYTDNTKTPCYCFNGTEGKMFDKDSLTIIEH